ncbi:response regulator [Henriciella mobilis]|uniref:response regulator n=1 Tax=Henriciella mobilis TaxID=2305467 RepID=UPI000E666CE7|nr:response regulator [Henriciella mobilis]RIJ14862.1 response regulator [Henriciella mobilis]RIJ21817.1 response regulator [Henriciella mobilis]
MSEPPHILVVDDDDRIRSLLKQYLEKLDYRVTTAAQPASARKLLATLDFDLAVFDIMMPGETGLDLLRSIRSDGLKTPVLLLTARGDTSDRIEGLKAGADDYLAKPFEPEELSLRVGAILRRTHVEPAPEEIEMSGMVFNAKRGELTEGDRRIKLTEAELQLLTMLAAHAGEPVSREELASRSPGSTERSIDVQVTRLRRKIEPDPKMPLHIQTVRGIGYRLMPD